MLKAKGVELILDAISPILTKKKLKRMLLELCDVVDMSPISSVKIVKGADYNPGLTGCVFIEFSSITIHSFTRGDKEVFLLNLHSCKDFSVKDVKRYLRKEGITDISSRLIIRKFKL